MQEAIDWCRDGGQIIVLVEAVTADSPELPPQQREHALRRSLAVPCGLMMVHVSITFAAFNAGRCRNLDQNNRCRMYARRPLVCQIYPMEINPHIPLRPHAKDCSPETWQEGPVLLQDGRLIDVELAGLIERSRQADRDEIGVKEAICQHLGIRTAAVKGEGFAAYLPQPSHMLKVMTEIWTSDAARTFAAQEWELHVPPPGPGVALSASGAKVSTILREGCVYLPLAR